MLHRSAEMGDETELPIVSVCVVADKSKCPSGFTVITKTFDDGSDADLWKEGFSFGIFGRVARYICVNRQIAESHCLEVMTDLAIISEKEAVPSNFVCIDFTADTKERALKKKYLCARFTARNDTLDAVTDICVLSRSRKPPKSYTIAGDVDGMLICYKVATIPEAYGRLRHSQSTTSNFRNAPLYPNVGASLAAAGGSADDLAAYRHSTSNLDRLRGDVNSFTIRPAGATAAAIRGIDGVPFQLSPALASTANGAAYRKSDLPPIPPLQMTDYTGYNFALERSIAAT